MKSNLKTELTVKQVNICEIAKLLRNFLKMSVKKSNKKGIKPWVALCLKMSLTESVWNSPDGTTNDGEG